MDQRSACQDFATCTADECENTVPFLAEKMSRIFGGESGVREESSVNMHPQKESDYFKLLEKIRLLEGDNFKQEEIPICNLQALQDDLFNPCSKFSTNVGSDQRSIGTGSQDSQFSKQKVENEIGIKLPDIEDNNEKNIQDDEMHLHNAHILSEIFNEKIQNTNDENKFMKVLFELNGIVKSLKEQKEIKDKKLAEVQQKLLRGSSVLSNEMINVDLSQTPLMGKQFQSQPNMSLIRQEDSNETVEYNQNKIQGKGSSSGNWRPEDLEDVNKQVISETYDQEKSIISMVENIAVGQQKEVYLMECLFIKLEDLAKSEDQLKYQTSILKNLEQRILNIEKSLSGNTFHSSKYEKEINELRQESIESNKVQEEFKYINVLIKNEFLELNAKLSLYLNKIEKIPEIIEQMKTSHVKEKISSDAKLNDLIKKTIEEEKKYFIQKEGQLLDQIKNLQLENNKMKQSMVQIEEDYKRVAEDHKNKYKKLQKMFKHKFANASQKLLSADNKVKEFFYTIEVLIEIITRSI